MSADPVAFCLLGPTASGKTDLALQLAQRLPLEIISLDSAQVFIDMDIGAAKPDRDTLARFPHHLVDLITPEQTYSAARFCDDAASVMSAIAARKRIPFLVGGAMLYFKALTQGLAELPEADAALRAGINAEAAARGWPALHAELARDDPAGAARIDVNDAQRIQRSLEVLRLTGEPLAAWWRRQPRRRLPWRLFTIAITPQDRGELHQRIARRFTDMLEAGFIAEVENLRSKYHLDASLPSMRCVGYRQVWWLLEGEISAAQLAPLAIAATRQFAKRQLTWLRAMERDGAINMQTPLADGATTEKIAAIMQSQLHSTAPTTKTTSA